MPIVLDTPKHAGLISTPSQGMVALNQQFQQNHPLGDPNGVQLQDSFNSLKSLE